jgi:hypothetical protein
MKEKLTKEQLAINERMKYEIADELGLLDKVEAGGWKLLTAKESGRIGGLMTKRKREEKNKEVSDEK